MSVHLLTSSDGVPLVAVCTDCDGDPGSVWVRAVDDPDARTLSMWMLAHRRARGLHTIISGPAGTAPLPASDGPAGISAPSRLAHSFGASKGNRWDQTL